MYQISILQAAKGRNLSAVVAYKKATGNGFLPLHALPRKIMKMEPTCCVSSESINASRPPVLIHTEVLHDSFRYFISPALPITQDIIFRLDNKLSEVRNLESINSCKDNYVTIRCQIPQSIQNVLPQDVVVMGLLKS
jgi:hypothetical protein